MDIAALSVVMKQSQLKQQASLAVIKNAMSKVETNESALIELLNQSMSTGQAPHPYLGAQIDLKG